MAPFMDLTGNGICNPGTTKLADRVAVSVAQRQGACLAEEVGFRGGTFGTARVGDGSAPRSTACAAFLIALSGGVGGATPDVCDSSFTS